MIPCLLKRSVIWCHHVLVLKSVLPLIEKFTSKGHPIKFYWTHDIEDLFSVFPNHFISSFPNWYDIYWQSRPEILDCQAIFNNCFYCPFTTPIFILFSIMGIELWVCFSLVLFLLFFFLKGTFSLGTLLSKSQVVLFLLAFFRLFPAILFIRFAHKIYHRPTVKGREFLILCHYLNYMYNNFTNVKQRTFSFF